MCDVRDIPSIASASAPVFSSKLPCTSFCIWLLTSSATNENPLEKNEAAKRGGLGVAIIDNQHFGWPGPPHFTVSGPAGCHNASAWASESTLALQPMMRQWWPPALLHSSKAPFEASALVLKLQVLPWAPLPCDPHPHPAHAGALVAARTRTLVRMIRCLCIVVPSGFAALALSRRRTGTAMRGSKLCPFCTRGLKGRAVVDVQDSRVAANRMPKEIALCYCSTFAAVQRLRFFACWPGPAPT